MKYHLELNYTVPTGDLAPYFAALRDGKALASACKQCGHVAFPARTRCGVCVNSCVEWVPLSGCVRVLFRTNAPEGSYALVQFDGADTATTVAIINPERDTPFGTLAPPKGDASGLWVKLLDTFGGDENGR